VAGALESGELRSRVRSGLRWKLVTQLVSQGARTFVAVLVAHVLSPHDYGLAAMAVVFTGIPAILVDFSLGAALIQRSEITNEDLSTVWWTSFASGLTLTAISIAAAPAVAAFFSNPHVAPLFAVASLSFVMAGSAVPQYAMLNRTMNFRVLELREVSATLVASVAAVSIALAGLGAWAIVGQALCVDVVSTALIWKVSPWRPSLTFSFASLRTLGSFGGKVFSARLLSYLNLNADNILVGRFLGTMPLGIYAIAYNVIFSPLMRITTPIQQVLFPAFSRLQHDRSRLGLAWIRADALVAAVSVPAFLGMAAVAPDFVPIVLGKRWHSAVPVVQLLSLAGATQMLQSINPNVLQAVGKAGTLLRYMVCSSAVTLAAFAVGLHWGIVGVAACYAVVKVPVTALSVWLTARAVGISTLSWARGVRRALENSLAMALAVYVTRIVLVDAGVPTVVRLVVLVCLGAAVYAALAWLRTRALVDEGRHLLMGNS
jgi:O-antigen/teichoic acid export membrane protein